MIKVEKISEPKQLLKFEKVWDDLYNSSSSEASVSFEWTYALLTTHLQQNDSFILILLLDKDTIVGILPLVITERKKFGQKLTTLLPISEYYNTHSDFLLRKFDDVLLRKIIKSLFQLERKWDVFRIGNILESNPIINAMIISLEKSSFKYEIKQQEPSFFIHLNNTYDEYLKKRSSKFRNYLRRMGKKLGEQGNINLVTHHDYDDISVAYEQLLEIEKNSWKQTHGTSISSISMQEEFYKSLIVGSFLKGRLHLLLMFLDQKPIAYNLGLINNGTYLYLKTSYDESYRKFGPSTVLRAELIQMLINNGIKLFDFPGEPYEWEKQWTEELRWHKSLVIYNTTIKATALRAYHKIRGKREAVEPSKKVHYHDPRNFRPKQ